MSGLFRQAALDKISNPDQLDQVLRVVRPVHRVGVFALLAVVIGGLIWSVLSTAPVSVRGQGILLSAEGVSVVSSPSEGHIESILNDVGDVVQAGQVVALLKQPAALDAVVAKQTELAGARGLLRVRQTNYSRHQHMQTELLDAKGQALTEQLEKLQTQREVLLERRNSLQKLLGRGFTTLSRLNEADTQLADLENRIASVRNEGVELLVKQTGEESHRVQEMREAALRVQALESELQNMRRDYERRRSLHSPVEGTIVEFNVDTGDLVNTGQIIMRLLPSHASEDQALRAIIFVPNEDGKKVEPGMAAHIMPSTTRLQKDGFIRGKVLSVAQIPSSREGIMRRLKNTTHVDALLRTGAPFEVELELQTDTTAPSGFRWSSGSGPDISIGVGTIAAADMIVERRRVISLALPFFDYVFRWLEVR